MRLRDGNIIVCDCGAELTYEITTDHDYITYADGIATCSNCQASGEISFPTGEAETQQTPTIEARLTVIEDIIMDLLV